MNEENNETGISLHPSTIIMLKFFEYEHLPDALQNVSRPFGKIAQLMAKTIPSSAEHTAGLRRLLEAKNCFIRASLE